MRLVQSIIDIVYDILAGKNLSFAPSHAARQVYQRVGLEDMSTLKSYQQWGKHYGLEFMGFDDQTNNLVVHYETVRIKRFFD